MEIEGAPTSSMVTGTHLLRSALAWGIRTVRLTLYAVLALLRPLIVGGLTVVSALGFLACGFYWFALHGTHFPVGVVLGLSVGCAVCVVLYYTLMDLLLPR